MKSMFSDCNKLSSLPDISKWDISNVTNMSSMFYNCNKLSSLPDISKWDTSKVNNMSYMFLDVINYLHYLIYQDGTLPKLLV